MSDKKTKENRIIRSIASRKKNLYITSAAIVVFISTVILVLIVIECNKNNVPTPSAMKTTTQTTMHTSPSGQPRFTDPLLINASDLPGYKTYIEHLRADESAEFDEDDYEDDLNPMITSIHGRMGHLEGVEFELLGNEFEYANNSLIDAFNNSFTDGNYFGLFTAITNHKRPLPLVYRHVLEGTTLTKSGSTSATTIKATRPFLTAVHYNCSATLVLNKLILNKYAALENKVLFERLLYLSGILWGNFKAFCSKFEINGKNVKTMSDENHLEEKYALIFSLHLYAMADTMANFMVYLFVKESFPTFENGTNKDFKDWAEKVKKETGKENELETLIGRIYQLFEILRKNNSKINDSTFFGYFEGIANGMNDFVTRMQEKLNN
eukprot:GAHX01000902.1.p1 GENE.GAHX01000902.1~~GAHX01000902.1.p1  ORF type:complete len:381 (-),score=69.18 GAHX01000902.1:23-1165(-)